MPMGVVHIRKMRMLVAQPIMPVAVRVRLARRVVWTVDVLVVLVVHVRMSMLHGLVLMRMLVSLGQMQPDADPHQ